MKKIRKKGMTLIEIIVALGVLGIITTSLLAIFMSSYSNIFSFGRKSSTLMEAQSVMDKIYESSADNSFSFPADVQSMVENVLNEDGYTSTQYKLASSIGNIGTLEGSEHIRYFVSDEATQSGIAGFSVTILVFYPKNNQSVSLTTFVVKEGS